MAGSERGTSARRRVAKRDLLQRLRLHDASCWVRLRGRLRIAPRLETDPRQLRRLIRIAAGAAIVEPHPARRRRCHLQRSIPQPRGTLTITARGFILVQLRNAELCLDTLQPRCWVTMRRVGHLLLANPQCQAGVCQHPIIVIQHRADLAALPAVGFESLRAFVFGDLVRNRWPPPS